MEDFGVYAIFGVDEPPQQILSRRYGWQSSVEIQPSVQLMVLFSRGDWGKRDAISVELADERNIPINMGKLTPFNKCLSWEAGEDGVWSNGATLTVKLSGGTCDFLDPVLTVSQMECTPECNSTAPALRECPGKRKRSQGEEDEEINEGRGKENICPNASEKATPHRRGKNNPRGGQTRLFSQKEEQAATSSSQSHKAKGKQAKTPSQTAPLDKPSGRWGQTLCPIDPQTAILIGGQGSRMQFCKDPIWKLCTEDLSWVPAETLAEGPTPEARIGHTATYDPESKRIFVFGGSKHKKWFNDVHILDTESWRWTLVEAQGKVPPLAYHSCSMFRGELFVFGGVFPRPHPEPDGCSDSLYIFNPDMAIWYQPIVNGEKPAPRSGHSACVMQGRIFVFGGWDTPVCFNDMFMLDLGLMEFSAVKTSGTAPSPRSWHGCAVLSDCSFLIHGGYNGNNALSDTFIFNTDTSCWSSLILPQLNSVPRAGHSIITMPTTCRKGSIDEQEELSESAPQTLLVFGGGDNEGSFFSDLFTMPVEELRRD
ncbi:kelch repeat-containing protein isoform X1 [Ctenopharyngodon idella]|uniref:kelch repeat-containing protein isoform X1 n=1 Tax=Ctenopharyngodon idella TaxID=7959 RepID=UPI00222E7814|nr:kelch repeat-containing protein isoform X1 [Ctenopharyngodon idella]